MKHIVFFALACAMVAGAAAQPSQPVRRVSETLNHHNCHMEQLAAKQNYRYRLKSFTTRDGLEFTDYFYNSSQQLVAVKDSLVGEYSVIDSLTYTDRGQIETLSGWQLLDGRWQNVYRIQYGYNGQGLLATRTNYNNFDGDWVLGGVYEYTYDGNGKKVLSQLTMNGIVFQKVEYDYDSINGYLSTETWYNYNGGGLEPSDLMIYTYQNDRVMLRVDAAWSSAGRWDPNGLHSYDYNADGDCVKHQHLDALNAEVERSVYVFYDMETPLTEVLMPWHPEMSRPYTYSNVHAYDLEEWHSVGNDRQLHHITDYLYEYEEMVGIDATADNVRLTVSPNPAHDYIVIDGMEGEMCHLQVVDVMGREVMTLDNLPAGQRVDIRALPAGHYVLRVTLAKGFATVKMVVE
ncbi:MAG: T9SS type A sorting domain-containing protein [Bacteroidales bacterium]|nr:T9SS type A sorting domain-containing protein [Bacteroidales bacterium]